MALRIAHEIDLYVDDTVYPYAIARKMSLEAEGTPA